jgi:hypothetical protein
MTHVARARLIVPFKPAYTQSNKLLESELSSTGYLLAGRVIGQMFAEEHESTFFPVVNDMP